MNKKRPLALWGFLIFLGLSAVIIVIQLIINPHPFSHAQPGELVSHQGESAPMVIDCPENWSFGETPQGNHGDHEVIAVINGDLPNMVIARAADPLPDLATAEFWALKRASGCENFVRTFRQDYATPHTTGVLVDYTCFWTVSLIPRRQATVPCRDYITIIDTQAYQLSFCATEEQWPDVAETFDAMLQSFHLVDPATP